MVPVGRAGRPRSRHPCREAARGHSANRRCDRESQSPMDAMHALQDYRAGKLQFTMSDWSPDYADVHTYADPVFGNGRRCGANASAYVNPDNRSAPRGGNRGARYCEANRRLRQYRKERPRGRAVHRRIPAELRRPSHPVVQGAAPHGVYIIQLRYAIERGAVSVNSRLLGGLGSGGRPGQFRRRAANEVERRGSQEWESGPTSVAGSPNPSWCSFWSASRPSRSRTRCQATRLRRCLASVRPEIRKSVPPPNAATGLTSPCTCNTSTSCAISSRAIWRIDFNSPTGHGRSPPVRPRHDRAGDRGNALRHRRRHSARDPRGHQSRSLARPCGPIRRLDRNLGTRVLARALDALFVFFYKLQWLPGPGRLDTGHDSS